jgi:hypothetical protein
MHGTADSVEEPITHEDVPEVADEVPGIPGGPLIAAFATVVVDPLIISISVFGAQAFDEDSKENIEFRSWRAATEVAGRRRVLSGGDGGF